MKYNYIIYISKEIVIYSQLMDCKNVYNFYMYCYGRN